MRFIFNYLIGLILAYPIIGFIHSDMKWAIHEPKHFIFVVCFGLSTSLVIHLFNQTARLK